MNKTMSVIGAAVFGMVATTEALEISRNGNTPYVIVIPDNAEGVLNTAAQELASHLKQVTKAEYPVVKASQRPNGKPAFLIGSAAEKTAKDFDFSNAKPDTTAIQFVGKDICLGGRMPRGPIYAVYTFLEDYVGIRWWTSEETYIPQKSTLDVEPKNYLYSPCFRSRETFYRDSQKAIFSTRLKNNGNFTNCPPEYGGKMSIIGWCHTFYNFLPPDKYFAAHPDWYSMIDGKRVADRTQLCLTNEEMRKEFVKVCLERIAKQPAAGIISVSQNDWRGHCQCPKCQAIVDAEGNQAGPLIRFVNAVAAEIKKTYPEYLIETLAYQETRHAPKLAKPADNVVIRLCSIEMNFAQPLETGEANASFRKDIEDWSAIAPNLYVWNYITNFSNYMLPQPNWRALGKDLDFFARHNAIGVFEQGDTGCNVGDFVRPRAWIVAHLLWNPKLDQRQLMNEFFNGYYGAAGKYLIEYIDFLCDKVEEAKYNLKCYNTTVSAWLSFEDVMKAKAIYGKAEQAVANDPVLAKRVRRERLSLDVAYLKDAKDFLLESLLNKPDADNTAFMNEALKCGEEFIELTKDAGKIREGGAFGGYALSLLDDIKHITGKDDFVPEICRNLKPHMWILMNHKYYKLHQRGSWVTIEDDKASAFGKAARMPNTHIQWATQVDLPNLYRSKSKWKAVFAVRCDAKVKTGDAMEFGVYSEELKTGLAKRTVKVSEVAGSKYVLIETTPFALGKGQYAWIAPVKREPEEVSAVYVDYVILMKAE